MAFDSFLSQEKAKPKAWRRLTYMLSLGLHGALLVAGAVYSFWNVDELSPPSVAVTFSTATPPPPPPPPPPKRKKTIVKPRQDIVQPLPNQIVQPKEQPPPEEEEDEGVEGGVEGGVPGGVVGSTGPVGPVMVAPNVGTGQRITDINDPRYKPSLPPQLNRAGMMLWGMFKICVSAEGRVSDVKIIKAADPLVDNEWVAKIKLWQYRPYTLNGRPVPFCHPARIEVRSQG